MDTIIASSTTNMTPLFTEVSAGATAFPRPHPRDFVRKPRSQAGSHVEPSEWSLSEAKRCVDFLMAAAFLLVFWPLLLLAALLVRLCSPGPVIFRQKRVGLGGNLFTVYKFRTMEVLSDDEGPSMTKKGDPRITTFGRFLRKYKLDELPQFINVLRGDMSLVGPRPRLAHHMDSTQMPFRPGLTGAATIAFRNEEILLQDIPDNLLEDYNTRKIIPLKARLDWSYMARATFLSDMALVVETAICCLSTRHDFLKIRI